MGKYAHLFQTIQERDNYIKSSAYTEPFVARCGGPGEQGIASFTKDADDIIHPKHNGHEYVEIAGIKWATMNIGATAITDYGKYYQWGDISGYTTDQVGDGEGQKFFNEDDYKYMDTSTYEMTKYNSTDNKTVLETSDDAVQVDWGGNWRMPNDSQVRELRALPSVWTTLNGVYGRLFTGNNGNTLFIPAAGYKNSGSVNNAGTKCYMWTCNGGGREVASGAGYFTFDAGGTDVLVRGRCDGNSCRGILIMPS